MEYGIRVRFRRAADVEELLRRLVDLEEVCCPFLRFSVEAVTDQLTLTVSPMPSRPGVMSSEELDVWGSAGQRPGKGTACGHRLGNSPHRLGNAGSQLGRRIRHSRERTYTVTIMVTEHAGNR
jgi:hypothetical protein